MGNPGAVRRKMGPAGPNPNPILGDFRENFYLYRSFDLAMGSTLSIWEDLMEDTSFGLFAIHSPLEDYALAYELNRVCGLRLQRMPEDLSDRDASIFPVFQWQDEAHFRTWTLFVNVGSAETQAADSGLFGGEATRRRSFLIPEKREVDFFLKVEGGEPEAGVLPIVLAIPKVITAYRLEAAKLKSKHNLIF